MDNFFLFLLIFLSSFNTYALIRTIKPSFLIRKPNEKEIEIAGPEGVSNFSTRELKELIFKKIGKTDREILFDLISTYLKNFLKFGPVFLFAIFNIGLYVLYSLSLILCFCITKFCKKYIRKLRPDGLNERSFPSGHTSSAFLGSSFFYYVYGHGVFSFCCILSALFVAYLRLYSKRHTFIDVFGGIFIGVFSGFIFPSLIGVFLK